MRIILGTESFPPNMSGVAVATHTLAENLAKARHEVFVLCPSKSLRTHKDRNYKNYTVYRLRSIVNPFRSGYRITFSSQKEVDNFIKKIKPDLIHIQDPAMIGNLLLSAGKKNNVPVVMTNHFSLEYALSYISKAKFFLPVARLTLMKYLVNMYNKCNLVITPTETIAKQVRSWGVQTTTVARSNGLFFSRFFEKISSKKIKAFKNKYHLPNNPLVIYLGRIDKDKSIDVLIKAIPEVAKKTNAHFVLVGSGDELLEMENLVDELDVRNKVTFLGRIEHESLELVAAYQASALFVIPSTIETQSIVTLEAMAAGLPVVAANANALPELVHNKDNGFVFIPGDYDDFAKKIIWVIENKKMAKEMAKESVLIAAEHEMKKTFGEMIRTYKEIIEKNGQAGDKLALKSQVGGRTNRSRSIQI